MLTNKEYIQTESTALPLFYNRYQLQAGDAIPNFQVNEMLVNGLKTCKYIVADMYWKPIGDSFLFLSVLQAAEDYLTLIRGGNKPKWILDKKFSNLMKHISFLANAQVVDSGIDWFKENFSKENAVFVTDEEPFSLTGAQIFNSENYLFPKFVEKASNHKVVREYPSRSARYYLTFEREVGTVLHDPNLSLPNFVMEFDEKLSTKIQTKYDFNIDDKTCKYVCFISQTSKVEKKFGLLRYLKIAKELLKDSKVHVLFLVNRHEESPGEWLKFSSEVNKSSNKINVIDTEDFEEVSYIFARCKVIVGNDTGFSHLAGMSALSAQALGTTTFIIYPEHDYGKWGSGKPNVKPITTRLSRYLTKNSLSVRRDKIDITKWGKAAWAYYISTNKVLGCIKDNIDA